MISVRRYWRTSLLLALCFIFFGTAQQPVLRTRQVVIVGTDNAPPYYMQKPNGEIVGVAVEVLTEAATELDFDLRFVHLKGAPDSFLRSRTVDLWPLLTITKEREQEFHMTEPWLYNTLCLLRLEGDVFPANGSFRLAYWANPRIRHLVQEFFPNARYLARRTREEMLVAICSGQADAGLIETRVLDSLLLARPPGCETAKLSRQPVPNGASPLGIMSTKEAANQADQLQQQITRMASNGQLARIFERSGTVTANEASSIIAMNAARQKSRFAYAGLVSVMITGVLVFWQLRRARKAEEAQRAADQTRNMVLEGAGEGICGLDAHGRTTFLNSAAARLLAIDPGFTQGHDFHALVHGADLTGCHELGCQLSLQNLEGLRVDSDRFCRTDGTRFPVEFTSSPLHKGGSYAGSVITFQDITARRQAETLDHDRNAVLEMLAENVNLTTIFEAIARLTEQQCPGMHCTIAVVTEGHLELRAAPSLPRALAKTLENLEIAPGFRPVVEQRLSGRSRC